VMSLTQVSEGGGQPSRALAVLSRTRAIRASRTCRPTLFFAHGIRGLPAARPHGQAWEQLSSFMIGRRSRNQSLLAQEIVRRRSRGAAPGRGGTIRNHLSLYETRNASSPTSFDAIQRVNSQKPIGGQPIGCATPFTSWRHSARSRLSLSHIDEQPRRAIQRPCADGIRYRPLTSI